jgi:esterase/lipase superfamily enzyme
VSQKALGVENLKVEYRKEYSHNLWRDMEYKVYGHSGKICLVFPCQEGRFYDYENFGMVNVLSPDIEAGRLQLVCADSIDAESLTSHDRTPRQRIEQYEAWYRYIKNELVPRVHADNPSDPYLMVTGCSLGAFHAANLFFRVPHVFDTVIGLSGLYHAGYFFGDYMDDLVYLNSPIDCLRNMPQDHPFMDLYRRSQMIFCVGQGAWEEELLADTRRLRSVLMDKGIPAWVDYWGYDVNHDWCWWRKQIRYFMDQLMNQPD